MCSKVLLRVPEPPLLLLLPTLSAMRKLIKFSRNHLEEEQHAGVRVYTVHVFHNMAISSLSNTHRAEESAVFKPKWKKDRE